MENRINEFNTSFNDETCLVYPKDPNEEGQRWFLRTPINEGCADELVLIGMNPSSAVKLEHNNKDGDRTTGVLLSHFPLDEDNRPREFKRITIVNLIPLVGGSSADLPNWKEMEGRIEILTSLHATFSVLPIVLNRADIIIPMWGDPESNNHPWKKHVLPMIKPLIAECRALKHFAVKGFIQRTDSFPYHCGFNKEISYWTREAWTDDASFLLEN